MPAVFANHGDPLKALEELTYKISCEDYEKGDASKKDYQNFNQELKKQAKKYIDHATRRSTRKFKL